MQKKNKAEKTWRFTINLPIKYKPLFIKEADGHRVKIAWLARNILLEWLDDGK